jgi:hypothetical protein
MMHRERSIPRDRLALWISLLAITVWNVISWQFPFFWDTVLNSKIAHWYLESGFSQLTVPEQLDAGHPPFFNLYLAGIWSVLGRSLITAHLAMLPFLLLLVWNFWKLAVRFLPKNVRLAAMVLLFCEPTFLAQSSMITPDIVLVSMFLTSINAIWEGKRVWLSLALIVMAASTFRGILAVPSIFFIDASWAWQNGRKRPNWRGLLPYLPVGFLTLIWLWVHYQAVGWLLTPPPETYGAHRKLVGIGELLRNLGIVGWRFLDFGRVAVWLVVLGGAVWAGKRHWRENPALRKLILAFLMPAALFTLLFIPFSNPIGMRYFLVAYLLLLLLAAWVIGKWENGRLRGVVLALTAVVLVSGHFWVYPDGIAKSWDSSLAHVPYFSLRKEMIREMDQQDIPMNAVCTDFPLLADPRYAELVDGALFHWKDIKEENSLHFCEYVLWSNISNGFEGEIVETLQSEIQYNLQTELRAGAIRMRLYQRAGSH